MQSHYTHSLTFRPPRLCSLRVGHRRADGTVAAQLSGVGEKVSGPHHGPGKHLCSCVYHFYIHLISFCVFLCVPQANTCQCAPLSALNIRITVLFFFVLFYLEAYHTLTRECTEKIEKEKKLPISVFPTSVECHRQVFFFTSLHLKSESTLGM